MVAKKQKFEKKIIVINAPSQAVDHLLGMLVGCTTTLCLNTISGAFRVLFFILIHSIKSRDPTNFSFGTESCHSDNFLLLSVSVEREKVFLG